VIVVDASALIAILDKEADVAVYAGQQTAGAHGAGHAEASFSFLLVAAYHIEC
jgi:uncharacterized protein with PIN domain